MGRDTLVWCRDCLLQRSGKGSHYYSTVLFLQHSCSGPCLPQGNIASSYGYIREVSSWTILLGSVMIHSHILHQVSLTQQISRLQEVKLLKGKCRHWDGLFAAIRFVPYFMPANAMYTKGDLAMVWRGSLKFQPFSQFQAMPCLLFYFQAANWQRKPWCKLVTTQN